jgi:predicted RNA binding protein YcfA (HicA-like mRNA interferase family)
MKFNELKRMLTEAGCFMEKQKKKHEWWVNPKNGQHFTIPRHQSEEVGKWLLAKIKRDAGLDD